MVGGGGGISLWWLVLPMAVLLEVLEGSEGMGVPSLVLTMVVSGLWNGMEWNSSINTSTIQVSWVVCRGWFEKVSFSNGSWKERESSSQTSPAWYLVVQKWKSHVKKREATQLYHMGKFQS